MNSNTPITATLRAVAGDAAHLLREQLRPLHLTVPQMEFLAVFADRPGSSGADAARANHVTPQTGTTIIRSLAAAGLVTVAHAPGEGRRITVTVTTAGHELLAKARQATSDTEAIVAGALGAATCTSLNNARKRLSSRHEPPPQRIHRGPTPSKAAIALDARCRGWADATGTPEAVSQYIATRYGSAAIIAELIARGLWYPDGDNYRFSS